MLKINAVIIGRNEALHIENMHNSLKEYNFNEIYILDRCTDNSKEICENLGLTYFETNFKGNKRMTSSARNFGLSKTEKDSDVLFLDMDRYVKFGSLNELKFSTNGIEFLLCENDPRQSITNQSQILPIINNSFWTCGIFVKRQAIKIIENYFGTFFPVFSENYWGGDDLPTGDRVKFMGIICGIYRYCTLNGEINKGKVDQKAIDLRIEEVKKMYRRRQ